MQSLQDLWKGFNATRVVFLDLKKMELQPETGLINVGPHACLSGDMHIVPGQMGASSQVPIHLQLHFIERKNILISHHDQTHLT